MVATFHLHSLRHRIKYRNLEALNTTQELLWTTQPCCSIKFIESLLLWFILVTCNKGIYISIYIYKVSYIHSFFFLQLWCFFLHYMLKFPNIKKNNFWNWWVACFIAPSIMWCDISGCSKWIHVPFYGVFFSSLKPCFLWSSYVLLIAESVSLDTSDKSTWKSCLPLE